MAPKKATSEKASEEKVTEEKPVKKTVRKKATQESSRRARVAKMSRALIKKATGQVPVEATYTTLPHIPTGSVVVDNLIGGQLAQDGVHPICPGIPRRKITEIFGPEASGKTTFALSAVVQAQQKGGVAMYLDFENAIDFSYSKTLGVDFSPDAMLFYQPQTLEEGFNMMWLGLRTGVDIIVVDSVAAMVPESEFKKKFEDPTKIGAVARALSENIRKFVMWLNKPLEEDPDFEGTALVFINQVRANINTGGYGAGQSETTPGGKALKFYSSLRLRLSRVKSEYKVVKDPYTGKDKRTPFANVTNVKIVKNKMSGTQGQSAEVYIRFGYGLDEIVSLIEVGTARGIIKKQGRTYTYKDQSFTRGKMQMRSYLVQHADMLDSLKEDVRKSLLSLSVPTMETKKAEDAEFAIIEEMQDALGSSDDDGVLLE